MTLTLFITTAIALFIGFMVFSLSSFMTKIAQAKQAQKIGVPVESTEQSQMNQLKQKLLQIACAVICLISGIISLNYAFSISENNPKLAQSLSEQYLVTVDNARADLITCYQGVLHAPKLHESGFEAFATNPSCTTKQLDQIKAKHSLDGTRDFVGVTSMIFLLSLLGFGVVSLARIPVKTLSLS